MKTGRLKYYLAAIISVVTWGFFSIPLRKIQHYPSDEILYYRIFTSLVFTWVFIALFRTKHLKSDLNYFYSLSKGGRRRIIILCLISGVLISGNWFTYIYAVNNVNLKSAAFAYMVCPLITAFAGFMILKEKLSVLKLVALGIALFSIIILAQGSLRDVLWSVFIAALYSFFLIAQKSMSRMDKFNMLGLQLLIAAILMFPFYVYSFKSFPFDTYFWTDIIIISIFFTIIPLFLSLYALIGMPSSTLGIIIYLNPIVAFAVAFFYFHEGISLHQVYAYSLLLAAVIVFNWNTIKEIVFKIPAAELSEITP
ncbi:MAG: EamA family transporter [Daejeonella sp.]|uniref:EamA family transporter n=1 Tax=Daejeonella sp. TaxID=2805397 RepID=UPI0027338B1D|nr:EamA family transporter [Daejeonella sp.]MDP3467609.1 EamA family transporter [Daejeonella sp.]